MTGHELWCLSPSPVIIDVSLVQPCLNVRPANVFSSLGGRRKESLLKNALTARRTGTGPDDAHVEWLMLQWLVIRDALDRK